MGYGCLQIQYASVNQQVQILARVRCDLLPAQAAMPSLPPRSTSSCITPADWGRDDLLWGQCYGHPDQLTPMSPPRAVLCSWLKLRIKPPLYAYIVILCFAQCLNGESLENQTEAKNNVETATFQDEILSERCMASLTAQEYETDGLNTVPTCVIKLLFNFRKVTALFSQILISEVPPDREPLLTEKFKAQSYKLQSEGDQRKAERGAVTTPFPSMTYEEALAGYGTDKPDTRFGMKFTNNHEYFGYGRRTGFVVMTPKCRMREEL
ncbi:Aspartyl-tRNA synthetase, mitochondrial [Anas platyrhynchos]|uniref:Aspartyl-tRNA synthetase, mitochondrial n=1 Tax=Anas platyrhynchos TaxID=8839 RepID=R0L9T6_ANAPL|nr:Aspartyl-tRNA synthetase, mitochondrial [Anas platyrhynchos]